MRLLRWLKQAISTPENRSVRFSQRLQELNQDFPDGMAILMHELYNAHMRRIVFNYDGVVPKQEKARIIATCKLPFPGLNEKQQDFFYSIAEQLPSLFAVKATSYDAPGRSTTNPPPDDDE